MPNAWSVGIGFELRTEVTWTHLDFVELFKEPGKAPGLGGGADRYELGRRHMLAVACGGRSPRVLDDRTPGVCMYVLTTLPS